MENENSIVPNDKPVYQVVAKIANRLLDANKDIPELYEKSWTVFLGTYKTYIQGVPQKSDL